MDSVSGKIWEHLMEVYAEAAVDFKNICAYLALQAVWGAVTYVGPTLWF